MSRECTDGEWPCEMSTHLAWLEAENARLESRHERLREAAEWYLECRETPYKEPLWPDGWVLSIFNNFRVKRQRENSRTEFDATVIASERDLRAELGEG